MTLGRVLDTFRAGRCRRLWWWSQPVETIGARPLLLSWWPWPWPWPPAPAYGPGRWRKVARSGHPPQWFRQSP